MLQEQNIKHVRVAGGEAKKLKTTQQGEQVHRKQADRSTYCGSIWLISVGTMTVNMKIASISFCIPCKEVPALKKEKPLKSDVKIVKYTLDHTNEGVLQYCWNTRIVTYLYWVHQLDANSFMSSGEVLAGFLASSTSISFNSERTAARSSDFIQTS